MAYWRSKNNATPIKQMNQPTDPNKEVDPNASINDRINAVVEKKVDEVVNNKQTGEGLV